MSEPSLKNCFFSFNTNKQQTQSWRTKTKKMQRRVSQRLAPLFCQQHQRLAASTQRSVTSVRKKLKQAQAAQAAQQVPESTPQLFEHFDTFYKKDYIKTINIPTIAQKKDACFPNEPKIDYRTLTNEDWVKEKRPEIVYYIFAIFIFFRPTRHYVLPNWTLICSRTK